MDSCSFLIYYLACFIQKLLQTGCYITVSYTHLDVYKRQLYMLMGAIMAKKFMMATSVCMD